MQKRTRGLLANRSWLLYVRGFFMAGLAAGVLGSGCDPAALPPDGTPDLPKAPGLYEASIEPFVVIVTTNRASGVPGTTFELQATVTANASGVAGYQWSEDGVAIGDNQAGLQYIPQTPGDHLVEVAVNLDDGSMATDGVLLKVFDPSATSQITASAMTPEAGMPGTFIRLESPALNDLGSFAQIRVGEGTPFEPFRPEPGVANFLIPLDAANGLTGPTGLLIHLLVDGTDLEQFAFVLSPTPELPGPPGDLTRQWIEDGPALLLAAQQDLPAIVDGLAIDLSDEERALLQAMMQLAHEQYVQVRDVLLPILGGLDEQSLATLDRVLIANGVGGADGLQQQVVTAKLARLAKNKKDEVLDQLCVFHDIMKGIQDAISAMNQAAAMIPLLALETAGSAITPTLVGMAKIVGELGIVGDILKEIDELVPSVERLEITATPSTLSRENEKAVIRLHAHLLVKNDICKDAVQKILNELLKRSVARLVQTVPLPRLARIVVRHSYINFGEVAKVETLNEMQTYLQNVISTVVGRLLSAAGVDKLLETTRIKFCAIEDRSQLDLQPEESILSLAPPDGGYFLNLQEETIDYYCNINRDGPVTIKVERPCGLAMTSAGPRKLTAQVEVLCGRDTCTEDASGVLQVSITALRTDEREANCEEQFKDQIHDRWVNVTFTNTDPQRPIAVAWILVEESDLRNVSPSPCERIVEGGASTMEQCLNNRGCGLVQFKPGGSQPIELLQPGETLGPYPYICEQTLESTIDPNSPGGPCDEDWTLETRTQRIIAQAVYCDNVDNRQANFCNVVGRYLHQFGAPYNGLNSIQLSDCP